MQAGGMTTFYVPEIGDRFTLISEWRFTLYAERRNMGMISLLGLRDSEERKRAMAERDRLFKIAFKPVETEIPETGSYFGVPRTVKVIANRVIDTDAFMAYSEIVAKLHNWPFEVSMPAGTELQVDRIYIRKGLKDFSSITFYVAESPLPILSGSKKSNRRFWAKLSDCNRMEIEREEVPQLALAS